MKTKKITFVKDMFEQGGIDTGSGSVGADYSHIKNTSGTWYENRIRPKNLLPVMSGRTVEFVDSIPEGYEVYEFDENQKYTGPANRRGTKFDLKWNTCYICILLSNSGNVPVTVDSVNNYIGGGLSMCERTIEFGKLADDSLFVKGRNFLLDTQNMNYNTEVYARHGVYHDTESLFNGCATIESTTAWQGYYINFRLIAERCGIRAGDNLTYSIWTKFQGIPTRERCSFIFCREKDAGSSISEVTVFDKPKAQIVSGSWFQVKATFTVTEDDLEISKMRIASSYYDEDNTYEQVNSQVWFACPKLEYGTEATPYSPAPEDYVNRTCADYDLTV